MAHTSETALSAAVVLNSPGAVHERVAKGRISWSGPLLLLPARSVLWMSAQSLVALLFVAQHRANPWRQACYWWSVCFTLADVGCILGMRFFLKREGLRLRDLIGPIRLRYGRDVFLGMGCFLLFSPGFFLGGFVAERLFYRSGLDPSLFIFHAHALPLWATLYSLMFFWPINSVVEEMTYQGFVLPRLEALTGRTWVAVAGVTFCFTLQHCALGFVPDWRSNLCRFMAFLPGCAIMVLIYVRMRRLAPLIVGHWIIDLCAVLITAVL